MADQPNFLSKLPLEILHNILKYSDTVDLVHVAKTCKASHQYISRNSALFRDVYLQTLGAPRDEFLTSTWNWEAELQTFTRCRTILKDQFGRYSSIQAKMAQLQMISEFATNLVRTSRFHPDSHTNQLLSDLFDEKRNRDGFMHQSNTFWRARKVKFDDCKPLVSPELRQASAKLFCYYGVPYPTLSRNDYNRIYPYAVSVVYDLRNYRTENLWGPFLDDGQASVNWEKMEAILIVLGHNIRQFSQSTRGIFKPVWMHPFEGAARDSYKPISLSRGASPSPPLMPEDPYNVTGTWVRVVCFLDFHELFHYNFTPDEDIPWETPRPPLDTTEAIRLIIMELHVTEIEDPGPEDGQDLPVVHYEGTARSLHESFDPNADSRIKGKVRLTKEGEVRWTGLSIYHGEERWKTEGIQIGGPNSGRGVVGFWFDKDWEDSGPAGPTAYWKISNETENKELLELSSDDESDFNFGPDEEDEENDESRLTDVFSGIPLALIDIERLESTMH